MSQTTSHRRSVTAVLLPVVVGVILFRFSTKSTFTIDEQSHPSPFSLLSSEQVEEFNTSGFTVIRGLFAPEQRDALVQAGENYYQQFHVLDFLFQEAFAKLGMQVWRQELEFAQAALTGVLPAISAQLLNQPHSVRLLKDTLFGYKSQNNTGCGFHIDDKAFWPASDDSTGVNFWIALSPITAQEGGGIRVVNQSALDPTLAQDCLDVIRADHARTCRMEEFSPSCHESMMKASVLPDLEPGDALVWDRNTFHRSEPFRVVLPEPKLRYTVRYIPDTAIAQGMLHSSVAQGQPFQTPYHPQVWPTLLPNEKTHIESGLGPDTTTTSFLVRRLQRKLQGLWQ